MRHKVSNFNSDMKKINALNWTFLHIFAHNVQVLALFLGFYHCFLALVLACMDASVQALLPCGGGEGLLPKSLIDSTVAVAITMHGEAINCLTGCKFTYFTLICNALRLYFSVSPKFCAVWGAVGGSMLVRMAAGSGVGKQKHRRQQRRRCFVACELVI